MEQDEMETIEPEKGTENRLVWMIAILPFAWLILQGLLINIFGGLFGRHGLLGDICKGLFGSRGLLGDYGEADIYWFIFFITSIILAIYDEKSLKKDGVDTSKFDGLVVFTPVYLYQRAKVLKQSKLYFVIFVVTLCALLLFTDYPVSNCFDFLRR